MEIIRGDVTTECVMERHMSRVTVRALPSHRVAPRPTRPRLTLGPEQQILYAYKT